MSLVLAVQRSLYSTESCLCFDWWAFYLQMVSVGPWMMRSSVGWWRTPSIASHVRSWLFPGPGWYHRLIFLSTHVISRFAVVIHGFTFSAFFRASWRWRVFPLFYNCCTSFLAWQQVYVFLFSAVVVYFLVLGNNGTFSRAWQQLRVLRSSAVVACLMALCSNCMFYRVLDRSHVVPRWQQLRIVLFLVCDCVLSRA